MGLNLRDRPVLGGERAAFDERVDLVAPIDRRRRQHVPVNERLREKNAERHRVRARVPACVRARARVAQTCDWGHVGPSHADGSTSRAFTGGLRLSPSGPTHGRVGCLTTSVNDSAASSCAWNASTSAAVGVSCEKNQAIRCAGGAWARRAPSHTAARRRLLHRFYRRSRHAGTQAGTGWKGPEIDWLAYLSEYAEVLLVRELVGVDHQPRVVPAPTRIRTVPLRPTPT